MTAREHAETVREALRFLQRYSTFNTTKALAALDALLATVERLEGERDEAYRQAAQADEAHMLTGKRCRDALEALRQASDCCARPPGVCFDPNLADGGQENPAP